MYDVFLLCITQYYVGYNRCFDTQGSPCYNGVAAYMVHGHARCARLHPQEEVMIARVFALKFKDLVITFKSLTSLS